MYQECIDSTINRDTIVKSSLLAQINHLNLPQITFPFEIFIYSFKIRINQRFINYIFHPQTIFQCLQQRKVIYNYNWQMLKRKRKIAKYISALHKKKKLISKQDVQQLKLQQNEGSEGEADKRVASMKIGTSIPKLSFHTNQSSPVEDTLWHDSDQQQIHLPNKNVFKKLQLNEEATQKQYEQRLKRFYNSRFGLHNWATQGEGQQQQDLTDLLNHQQIYAQGNKKRQQYSVDFIGRTTEKHNSVVTGIDFKNNIAASCGYDQKLKIWSLNSEEINPELRIKLEKDVYTEKYSLSGCFFRHGEIVLGTLRQNYLVVDYEKWKITHIGSSFLNQHSKFQNIRQSKDKNDLLLFSENKISIVDHRNTYQGSLLAGQPLIDAQFGSSNYVFGISNDVVYQWDLRNWKLVESKRDCLGNTKLWTEGDLVGVGNKLGIVRLSNISQGLKNFADIENLVTHVTTLQGTSNGNLLVECSKWKQNAIRLIDTSKGRCISGFPTTSTKVGLASAASFSSRNELAIGNSHGYLTFFNVKGSQ